MTNNASFFILLTLCFTATLAAQTHSWVRTNPGGGGAFSTVGASASGIIIAGSDLSGAYRSTDGGLTWDIIGLNKGMTETHVSGVGFHRTDGNTLYIGTENGIFRSTDGGNSVSHVLVGGYITDIEFGTNAPNTGYATYHPTYDSDDGTVYRSTDNGVTWSQSSVDLPAGIRILKIVVNPSNADTVYILTGKGRFACGPADVFRSADGGVSWSNLTTGLQEVLDLAIDPSSPQELFITTMNANCGAQYYWTDLDGDLYHSTDGGTSWGSSIYSQSGIIWVDTNNSSNIRLIDPREPYPWVATSGTWTSSDGGNTFSQTGDVNNWDIFFNSGVFHCYGASFNGICKTLGEDLSNPNQYYWVTSQWIFKTTDNGTLFNNIFTDEVTPQWWQSRGFDNVNMLDVSISPADANIIYAAYFDIGLWRSLDKGASWQSCNDDVYSGNWSGDGGNCVTVLADPERSHVVWASQSENQSGQPPTYLLKNMNTGDRDSWVLSNAGLPDEEVMGLSLDVNSSMTNRTLFVTAQGDVYKSTDDGATWTMVLNCGGCRFTAVDFFDADLIYAGGDAGLWVSEDGGTSWSDKSDPEMPASSGVAFWDYNYDGVFDVTTDPANADRVYVTAFGNGKGLFKSTDRGASWEKILTDDFMRKVAIVPMYPDLIYATSSSALKSGGYHPNSMGVLFSDDGGQNWAQENQNMAYPFAMPVAVDHTGAPTVFVGSPGTGFQKADIPIPVAVEYLSPLRAMPGQDCVELIWSTATEENNKWFVVQRSADARQWDDIFHVNGQGNIMEIHRYRAKDSDPLIGMSYYRLQQVDWDGSYQYSNVASVRWETSSGLLKAYPNPASANITFEFDASAVKPRSFRVFDAFGNIIFQQQPVSSSILAVDVSQWSVSVYFAEIMDEDGRQSRVRFATR